ncbi:MAG: flagellar protein FlgN, partial [Bacilli bacterium]
MRALTYVELITNVFNELVEAHHSLHQLSEKKKDAIIKGNIDGLSEVVREEGKVVRQIGKLEVERIHSVSQYLQSIGISTEGVTMNDLVKLLPSVDDKKKLQELQGDLTDVIMKLQKANDLNQELLQQSLNFVNHSLDLFTETEPDQGTYGNPNQQQGKQQQRRGIFD